MIYRQVIPPAPAYLGLNLYLKGTQLIPKNGGGKKEKKLDSKTKFEYKNALSVKPANGENEKTPILSPRSLLIDFADSNESNSLSALNSVRKRVCTLTRSNKENVLKNDKTISGRLHSYLALTRYPSKHSDFRENPLTSRKVIGKIPDSSRRHASCGPKLMSIVAADENKTEETEAMEDDRNNIKCVGNKFGPEVETNDSIVESNKSSPRKQSQETPRIASIRAKLKPVNTLSKSARALMPNSKDKSPAPPNEYRKYLAHGSLQALNKIPAKLPIHSNYYNSHFYAVGLSLRAWRSKYNRIKGNGPNMSSTLASNNPLKRKNA